MSKSRIRTRYHQYHQRDGVSLLIAIGLVTVIGLFSLIVSNVVITSIRQSANVNRANEAYYAAEGALEQGLLANSQEGAGFSTGGEVPAGDSATYEIQGQVPETAKYGGTSDFTGMYGIPTPGTGNVGEDCDPLEAWTAVAFTYNNGEYTEEPSTGYDPADHPCNWNRITVGQTVSIPLYVYDPVNCPSTQDGICNPADLNMNDLRLRVRTPCSNGEEMCSETVRFTLDEDFGDPDLACDLSKVDGCGDTIVSWSISGTDLAESQAYQFRPLAPPNPIAYDGFIEKTRKFPSSDIYEYLINRARTLAFGVGYGFGCDRYCVLNEERGGEDLSLPGSPGLVLQFLMNDASSPFARTGTDVLHRPVLKLSVINSLRDDVTEDPIPYLEYQLITNVNAGYTPTDASQTITAEGFSGEFKSILEVKQPQEGGLLEYVIQQ